MVRELALGDVEGLAYGDGRDFVAGARFYACVCAADGQLQVDDERETFTLPSLIDHEVSVRRAFVVRSNTVELFLRHLP